MKDWFVTMNQKEVEAFTDPYKRLVYEAIKSFCGNGKIMSAASNSEIAQRGNISKMTVGRCLPTFVAKGFIEIVGTENRVGGPVNVYKVFPERVVSVAARNTLSQKSVSPRYQSVTPRGESVTEVGTKLSNIKGKKTISFSYKNQKLNDGAGFSPDFKNKLFDIAEAISIEGGPR